MRLKDIDIKELGELFEEALNRAQRLDKQQRIRMRKKIRNELYALMSWDMATPAGIVSRWEERMADVFAALPHGFKDEIVRTLADRMRSPLMRRDATAPSGTHTA
jgi:hypothetical protein